MLNQGVFYLTIFSILTGLGGYFVKQTIGINSQQILFYRAVFATLFIFIFVLITKQVKKLSFQLPFNTILMGAVQGLSIYFYYLALTKTTITNATLLVYTAPLFSIILSAIFLKENIRAQSVIGVLISFVGVLIILDPTTIQLGSDHMLGSLFAIFGGLLYSAMAISSKSLSQKTSPLYCAFWQYFIIAVLSVFFAAPFSIRIVLQNSVSLLYLGIAAGGIAFLLYMEGIKQVKGQVIQIVTSLEVLVASLSGVLLLQESVSLQTIVGGICILIGIYIATISTSSPKSTK